MPSLVGQWGGDHVSLTISDTASHVELDCAHGDFGGAPTSTPFTVNGSFVREHGGPIAIDEVPDRHPATYVGSVSGSAMTLMIRLNDTNDRLGPFKLARGSPGRLVKCL